MSVIQNIRDKYARWAVIAIAVSLLGFILMDAFAGRTGLFSGGGSNTVGKINGKSIDYKEFAAKVQDYEKRSGTQGDFRTEQAVQDVWNQQVAEIVMQEQFSDLGISVTDKELKDILYGANPPQDLRQRFTDPNTGVYNAAMAQQAINQVSKSGSQEEKAQVRDYINGLENQRLMEKYSSLLANTVYIPKWFIEKRNADNALMAKVSYVNIPYTTISDSTIKVTDDDINNFMNEHKKDFEQKEETRSINYVLFSGAPSATDSATVRNAIIQEKVMLDTAKNYGQLMQSAGGSFYDSYVSAKSIQNPNKDSILKAPVGTVYGPYLDNGLYAISKIIDEKVLPDTVKVRHILIATQQQNPQTGQSMQVRDDSTAKHLIDSVQKLLNAGQSFDSLVVKFSDDPGSKAKGGVYENVYTGMMVPSFNDFIFTHKKGDRGVVKTDYGYHLVEILEQKGSSPAYKIAYLSKEIVASQETDDQANNNANMFAGSATNLKTFNDTWEKNWKSKGVNKLVANDLKPMDFQMGGVQGNARSFVRKIFDADKNDVVGPERIGDSWVVGIVLDINKPGLPSVARVRSILEPVLRNKKKGEQIKKNIGTVTDLTLLSQKVNQPVQTVDSLMFNGGKNLSFESKVIGAAFNPANKGKVTEPIIGQAGVYVIRTETVGGLPVNTSVEQERAMLEQQEKQGQQRFLDILQRSADIKDYRSKFY